MQTKMGLCTPPDETNSKDATKSSYHHLGRHTSTAHQTANSELLAGHASLHRLLRITLSPHTHSVALLNGSLVHGADHLDVSGMSLVGADAAVSAVGAASHHGSLVHLHVGQLQVLHRQTLRLAVGLEVVQQHQEVLAGSHGPSALIAGGLDGVALSVATHTAVVASERDGLLVGDDIVQIALSLHQRHASDGVTDFASVLEVDREVRTTSLAAYTITKGNE